MKAASVNELGDVLLATVQGELTDHDVATLRDDLTEGVADRGANGVLIDVSELAVVDSYLARTLHDIASGTALLGARTVLVGIRPEVAITLVELGLTLPGMATALTLADGLAKLHRPAGPR